MLGNLILIRGISGSGKTTKALEMLKKLDAKHFEADMYFMGKDGIYNFDPSKLQDAHKWCQDETRQALLDGHNVIVSNTFTRLWEMKTYREMEMGSLAIFECKGNYESVHNVPKEAIQSMKDRWEELHEKE